MVLTFSLYNLPLFGVLLSFFQSSISYLRRKQEIDSIERPKCNKTSATFLACICLLLGLIANIKFEVITLDDAPIPNDLHLVLVSDRDNIYVDDVDASRVVWCIESSDCIAMFLSSLLIWNTSLVRSSLSEYLFLPGLGVILRGLIMRQTLTACALLYTVAVVDNNINLVFLASFLILFLLEVRMWVEMTRLVYGRWCQRHFFKGKKNIEPDDELEKLWRNEEAPSFEVRNFVY